MNGTTQPANQIKVGAALSYFTIVLMNVVGIVLTPFIIRMLGDDEYGLYLLIGAFVGYLTLLDFGLTNTIVRYVAKYRAENDGTGENDFLGTVMLIYVFIALLIMGIGSLVHANLELIFGGSLSMEELNDARIMFLILIFNLVIALPGGAFGAIANGYERFVFPRVVNIARYLIRSVMIVAILWLGGKAVAIVVVDTIMNVSAILMNMYYVKRRINVTISFRNVNTLLIRKILGYSVWIFILAVVGQFQWGTGQVVLGILVGTKLVAVYGIGVILGTYYGSFGSAISGLFLPRATKMIVNSASPEELTNSMIRIGRLSLFVLLYVLGGFILFGRDFIHLWVGDGYQDSWFVALLVMVGYTTPLVQSFANSILEARAMLSFKGLLYLFMTILGAVLGAVLVEPYGVAGMAVGLTLAWVCSQVVMNVFFRRVLKLNIARFFKELFAGISIPFVIVMIVCSFLSFDTRASWGDLVLSGTIYSALYALLMFSFGMNAYEKNIFTNPLHQMRIGGTDVELSSSRPRV